MQWRFGCYFLRITYSSYTGGSFKIQKHLLRFPIHMFLELTVVLNRRWSSHCTSSGGMRRNIFCLEHGMDMVLLSHGMLFLSHLISMLKSIQALLLCPKYFISKQTTKPNKQKNKQTKQKKSQPHSAYSFMNCEMFII